MIGACPSCFKIRHLTAHGVCRPCAREAETLVPDLWERTKPADFEEIEARRDAVKARRGHPDVVLSLNELDEILPPTSSGQRARTGKKERGARP